MVKCPVSEQRRAEDGAGDKEREAVGGKETLGGAEYPVQFRRLTVLPGLSMVDYRFGGPAERL